MKYQFQQQLNSHDRVIADFSAQWCPPCRTIAPIYERLAKENPDVVFLHIDVDEVKDLSQAENISSIPAFRFYFKQKVQTSFEGADEGRLTKEIHDLKAK